MELTIEHVSKTYANGVQALRDITLTIPTGMFGLLGPNGSGKTTLMRSIATLQDVDRGSIRLGSIDVLRDPPAVRRQLGYLPQDFGVYPNLTAAALLSHLAVLKGIAPSKFRAPVVEGVLKQTNLWEVRNKKLGSFSGGMKQRFGVAQALLGDPRLIIVDEPTAGLDPEERRRFLNLLSEIGQSVIVILSTHIVEDVSEVCSRMAIIRDGMLLTLDEPLSAVDRMRGKVWKKVIPRAELDELRRQHRVLSTRLMSGKTYVHVLSDGAPGPGFAEADPDLEDVYFAALAQANVEGACQGDVKVGLG